MIVLKLGIANMTLKTDQNIKKEEKIFLNLFNSIDEQGKNFVTKQQFFCIYEIQACCNSLHNHHEFPEVNTCFVTFLINIWSNCPSNVPPKFPQNVQQKLLKMNLTEFVHNVT